MILSLGRSLHLNSGKKKDTGARRKAGDYVNGEMSLGVCTGLFKSSTINQKVLLILVSLDPSRMYH